MTEKEMRLLPRRETGSRMDDLPAPIDIDTTALLIIDMQRDFCDAGGYAAQAGLDVGRLAGVVEQAGMLLAAARAASMTVIHTREGHLPDLSDCPPEKLRRSRAAGAEIGKPGPMGRLLVRGEFGHDIIDALRPLPDERVIDKPGYGAFYRTPLEALLHARGIRTLILCGVTTEVCVHSTLREAVDRGLHCITVGDACAAGNPALQQPAMDMIRVEGGIFGRVADAAQMAAALRACTDRSDCRGRPLCSQYGVAAARHALPCKQSNSTSADSTCRDGLDAVRR